MPVRKRKEKRIERATFEITPELLAAYRAYIDSPASSGPEWAEHWRLHDLLEDAGALPMPLIPPCCWHPGPVGVDWNAVPWALAVHRRLTTA